MSYTIFNSNIGSTSGPSGRGFSIACLNINSLIAHVDQLRTYVHSLGSNIDVLAINETNLDSSITNDNIQISGFDVVRRDRQLHDRNGDGVCMYVKSKLNFEIREDLVSNDLELLFIQISNPRSKPFLVGTSYRPPSSALNLFSLFHEIIDKIDSENSELYLLGDLYCNLLSHSPNVNTRELLDICDIFNLTQLITEPTRVTNISQSLIDLCITNTPDKITASGVQSLGISDHSLVYLVRKSTWQEVF